MMDFSRLAQGERFDDRENRAALNLCKQLMGEALEVGPIIKIIETYRGGHGQRPML